MYDHVKLDNGNTVLDINRVTTKNYVLDIVDFGEHGTNYTLLNTREMVGLELDVWYHTLSTVAITGWVLADPKDEESMTRRKMRLNRFVVPNRPIEVEAKDYGRGIVTTVEFTPTQSIRYGTTEADNNDAFCKFLITGVYKQTDLGSQNLVPQPPGTPEFFNVVSILDTSVVFRWAVVDDANWYRIEYSSDGNVWTIGYEGIDTSVSVTGLEPLTEYSFRLSAWNSDGRSDFIQLNVKTLQSLAGAVVLTLASQTYNSVTLTWNEVSNTDYYRIERSSLTTEWEDIYSGTDLTFTDANLAMWKTFSYRAFAVNEAGDSPDGNIVTIITGIQPTQITATVVSWSTINLEWKAQYGAARYHVQWSLDGISWNTLYDGPNTTFSVLNLQGETNYWFRVAACDNVQCSSWSQAQQVTTLVKPPPVWQETLQTSGFGASGVLSICESEELELFVAVGAHGKIATSIDGVNWNQVSHNTGLTDTFWNVCWSKELGLFVVGGTKYVSGGDATTPLITSPDGYNWTLRDSKFVIGNENSYVYIEGIAWSPELSLFVIVGSIGSGYRISTSPDGYNWTRRTVSGLTGAYNSLVTAHWNSELKKFIAGGQYGRIYYSVDGVSWSYINSVFGTGANSGINDYVRDFAWSKSLQSLVMIGNVNILSQQIGNYDEVRLVISQNATNWSPVNSNFGQWGGGYCVARSEEAGIFVIGGNRSNLSISKDGYTWVNQGSAFGSATQSSIRDIIWSKRKSMFILVGATVVTSASVGAISTAIYE